MLMKDIQGKLQAVKALDPSLEGPLGDEMAQSVPNLRAETMLLDVTGANVSASARGTAATQAALIQALIQQLRQTTDGGAGPVKEFDWITQKPSPIYYPPYATQSLDDTPEIYDRAQSRDVRLSQSLHRYLENHGAKDIVQSPGYTISNVGSYITKGDLCLLDLFDVFQNNSFQFHTERQSCGPPSSRRRVSYTNSKASNHETAEESTTSDYETVLHLLNDSVCFQGSCLWFCG